MSSFIAYTLFGLFSGAAYAIAASGLVLTYTTTRVFNIAHGAFGMVMAFTFWDFSQRQGMPTWLALVLVLGVVAPATGWFVQRFVTRGLGEGPVSVSLVVTVGLFVGLIGLAQYIWPPAPRTVPPFLAEEGVKIGGTYVTAHQIITIALSALVAAALYALLNNFVDPRALYWTQSGDFVIMAVLGGMRSFWGPLIGAAIFVVLQDYLSSQTENWMSFVGLFFVLIVLFFPRGVLGALKRKATS